MVYLNPDSSAKLEQPLPTATSAIGIDIGIARFATFSNGGFDRAAQQLQEAPATPCALPAAHESQDVKFSSNWRKAKAKVQKIHTHNR